MWGPETGRGSVKDVINISSVSFLSLRPRHKCAAPPPSDAARDANAVGRQFARTVSEEDLAQPACGVRPLCTIPRLPSQPPHGFHQVWWSPEAGRGHGMNMENLRLNIILPALTRSQMRCQHTKARGPQCVKLPRHSLDVPASGVKVGTGTAAGRRSTGVENDMGWLAKLQVRSFSFSSSLHPGDACCGSYFTHR